MNKQYRELIEKIKTDSEKYYNIACERVSNLV